MSLERSEIFFVRFNGKNYSAWAFPFELFVKGKELWSHISDSAPDKEKEKEKYAKWEVKDAQIMSWILGSVEPSILLSLKPYKTSRGMWDYLKNVYNQSNSARRFQLELELSQLNQGRHIIKECSIRPQKKHETAYNVSVGPSSVSNAGQSTITPEMVQQMIVSALSAFGLSGNNTSDSKPWYFDSGASHHMTNTALPLKNVQKYSGDLQIHTADGNSLPITVVGDISASLNNVFVSPKLSTNLISVGQLVDNNCTVRFSKSGCFVQDQVSGKMIAKGPKVGRLFPLFLSPPPVSNYVACNVVQGLTMASSHQPATTDSVPPSSSNPTPLRRSSRPHKPVERMELKLVITFGLYLLGGKQAKELLETPIVDARSL
nr:Retrovirus-related Pol polyprotein from transposon TNT 1-94 [Ipomoea trifida]